MKTLEEQSQELWDLIDRHREEWERGEVEGTKDCAAPRCFRLVPPPGHYCPDHQ